jgi:hypothetical protein
MIEIGIIEVGLVFLIIGGIWAFVQFILPLMGE